MSQLKARHGLGLRSRQDLLIEGLLHQRSQTSRALTRCANALILRLNLLISTTERVCGPHPMPRGQKGKGRGVGGVPGLQGGGQTEADGGVEAFQPGAQPGQPRVQPSMQRYALCLRLPLLHRPTHLPAAHSCEASKSEQPLSMS